MAIAFDAIDAGLFDNAGTATSFTLAHTCTGSNLTLVVPVQIVHGTAVTGMTYNGVTMTLSSSNTGGSAGYFDTYVYTLIAPATGTNNIVFTVPSVITGSKQVMFQGQSYTGTNQSAIDSAASRIATPGSSPFAVSTTVVASNCWLVGGAAGALGVVRVPPGAGAGTTYRGSLVGNMFTADSNGTVSTGSQALNFGVDDSGASEVAGSIVSLAPAAAATSTANFFPFF
jgi:hypothetical protein